VKDALKCLKLWCGMGDGCVSIVDAEKGRREANLSLHRQIVTCVCALGATVWTGETWRNADSADMGVVGERGRAGDGKERENVL
jgi:hypothetical protein